MGHAVGSSGLLWDMLSYTLERFQTKKCASRSIAKTGFYLINIYIYHIHTEFYVQHYVYSSRYYNVTFIHESLSIHMYIICMCNMII